MSRLLEKSLFLLSLLLAMNVTVINLLVLHRSKENEAQAVAQASDVVCDALCQKNVAVMVKDQIRPSQSKQQVQTQTVLTKSEPREYILPLGSGSVDTSDWSDVPGVEIMIDTSKYPPIKQAYFETYISIPAASGFAHAKLFNVTDKHDVWFSEVLMEADKIVRQEVPITLASGEKRYKVMMKSTLERDALLHNARIKLVTE